MKRTSRKHYLLILFLLIGINFALPRLMPGDPFFFISVTDGISDSTYSEEQIARYEAYYGLDAPLYRQFISYLGDLLRGYLGYSIYYNRDVAGMILSRLPWTLGIVLTSLILSALSGVVLGALSAWLRGGPLDSFLYGSMVTLSEIPPFLLGVFFLFTLGAFFNFFPLSGGATPFAIYPDTASHLRDLLYHGALPVLTLSLSRLGDFYLLSRNSMVRVLSREYILTARGKGLSSRRILFKHALKNALPPIIARFFMSLGMLFGGAVLVENVYNYPGVGRLMREAVLVRDYVLLQGIFLFITVTVLVMNILAEEIYHKLDPRLERRQR